MCRTVFILISQLLIVNQRRGHWSLFSLSLHFALSNELNISKWDLHLQSHNFVAFCCKSAVTRCIPTVLAQKYSVVHSWENPLALFHFSPVTGVMILALGPTTQAFRGSQTDTSHSLWQSCLGLRVLPSHRPPALSVCVVLFSPEGWQSTFYTIGIRAREVLLWYMHFQTWSINSCASLCLYVLRGIIRFTTSLFSSVNLQPVSNEQGAIQKLCFCLQQDKFGSPTPK